jgi:hypothetical protein
LRYEQTPAGPDRGPDRELARELGRQLESEVEREVAQEFEQSSPAPAPTSAAPAAAAPAATPVAPAAKPTPAAAIAPATPADTARPKIMHYRIDTHGSISSDEKAFAILAEFRTTWSPGAFDMADLGPDSFYMNIDCPCWRYRATIETTDECTLRPAEVNADAVCGSDPHWGERNRFQHALDYDPDSPLGIHCDLRYPFPGTKYELLWKWTRKSDLPEENACVEDVSENQSEEPPPPPQTLRDLPPPPPST